MAFVILLPTTALIAFWFVLLSRVENGDWLIAAYNKVLDNILLIEKLRMKESVHQEKLLRYRGIAAIIIRFLPRGDAGKKIRLLEAENERLRSGDLKKTSIFPMPGYVLQRRFETLGKGSVHKTLTTKYSELYNRKYAEGKAKHMLAKLLSYPVIGVCALMLPGSMFISAGNSRIGAALIGIGPVLIIVLVYAMYDELSDRVKKRRAAIGRQFPNVVSKLALLMTSGMIMDRAWKETSYSQETELYMEMRKTSQELDNLVSPEAAYGGFISRCSTKETAKLASAIMQNLAKGNAEIGRFLKDMAREAWLERRHTAKRDAEKANSKLMIPTLLIFVAILLILLVPIAMNFSV